MSGGQKTTTQQSSNSSSNAESDPYLPTQGMLQNILNDAQRVYGDGTGSKPYTGETYAGLGATTNQGLGDMSSVGQSLVNNGGINSTEQGGLNTLNGTTAGYQGLLGDLSGPTQTEKSLQDTADGKFLDAPNPYLSQLINQGASDAANQVAAQFSASGRYGGGSMGAAIAKQTGQIATSTLAQEYDQERARQASAAQAIDSAGLARTGASAGLLGDIGNVGAQNIAAGQAANSTALQGAAAVYGAGQVQDADRQAADTDAQTRWNASQAQPWNQLGLYTSIVDPIAGLGGTTWQTGNSSGQGTSEQSGPSIFQSILGGATAAAGVFGKLSDERAKEDIQEVGKLHDGQPVYSYRYKGSDTPEIGLLAQEVAGAQPDAVGLMPGTPGLLGVDYGRATARAAAMAPQHRIAA